MIRNFYVKLEEHTKKEDIKKEECISRGDKKDVLLE